MIKSKIMKCNKLMSVIIAFAVIAQMFSSLSVSAASNELNLAYGLEVFGTDGWTATMPENAFDGDRETYWQSRAYPVKGRFIGVDAGEGNTITFNKVFLCEIANGDGFYASKGFNIEVSNDLKNWSMVANGIEIGEYGVDVYFETITARAVRYVLTDSYEEKAVLISEMEVYLDETYEYIDDDNQTGYEVTTANIALNKTAIGTEGTSKNTIKNAFDGNMNTYWMPAEEADEVYIAMDSGEEIMTTFNAVKITEKAVGIIPVCRITSYKLQYSRDLNSWLDIPGANGKTIGEDGKIIVFPTLNTRAVRIVIESTIGLPPAIAEFGVYNDTSLNSLDTDKKQEGQQSHGVVFEKPENTEVLLNRKLVDFDTVPVSVNNTKMVPLRGIYDAAGGSVSWNAEDNSVTAVYEDKEFKIMIGNSVAYLNGEPIKLAVPPISIDGRIQVPIEGVCEALGAVLNWRSEKNAAYITLAPKSVDILLDEDFENVDNHKLSREWTIPLNFKDRGATITTDETGNKCIMLEDYSTEQESAVMKTIPEVKGKIDISFKMRFNKMAGAQIRVLSGEKYILEVLFRGNEQNVLDGITKKKIHPYVEGIWYNFVVSIDTANCLYTISMYDENNNKLGEQMQSYTDTKMDSVSGIAFFIQGSATGVVLIDDVAVKTTDAVAVDDKTFFVEQKQYGSNPYRGHAKVRTIVNIEGYEKKPIETCKFGGRCDKKYEATGFYRTEKIDGRWWIIDPCGHPYYDRSPACVEYDDTNAATIEKFGKNTQKWLDYSINILREHGFTGMGCWSSDTINMNSVGEKIPYTYKLNANAYFGEVKKKYPNTKLNTNEIFPVFDREYEEFCDEIYKDLAALKDDPYLIGYFTANEIPLGASSGINALDKYLALDPTDPGCVQSYNAAWAWFREKCGEGADISMLNNEIREEFRGYVFGKFNEVSAKYIKKYDPNHLTIGTRMHGAAVESKPVWQECAKYLDIISVNVYHKWDVYKYHRMFETLADHPFLVTEYYAKAEETGLGNDAGAGFTAASLNDKGLFYQTFGYGMLYNRNCVGTQWFTFRTDTTDGTDSGFVSYDYTPYPESSELIKEFNNNIYSLIDYVDAKIASEETK